MVTEPLVINSHTVTVHTVNTLVIGSGAAGLRAAVALHEMGPCDVAVITTRLGGGTSANAGSDKQTYYKIALTGADSARRMAEDLWSGGAMHGDIALCEAQHSAQAFFDLVRLGVPFPHDRYGGYPGYRTDHDSRGRATSAGPFTSRFMVEALARETRRRAIPVLDQHQAVALILHRDARLGPVVAGAIALDLTRRGDARPSIVLVNAVNVVLATGGPGGLYAESVYPTDQVGAIGMALRVGAPAHNLTESQFGLASLGIRWNLSGSYQQVIPRYLSTTRDGREAYEFLNDAFPDMASLAEAVFRKGYEWPFDVAKVAGHASSLIDLLVHRERVDRGRRVWLDYSSNPIGDARIGAFALDRLPDVAREYLERSGAMAATPYERLMRMNPPAVAVYRERGLDLATERLEMAVCAQHNNGGLVGDAWWQSEIGGLFPIGEVCGTHGVRRPGGSALNAGQVGAIRAAMFIVRRRHDAPPPPNVFVARHETAVSEIVGIVHAALAGPRGARRDPREIRRDIQVRMSRAAGHVRSRALVERAVVDAWTACDEAEQRAWAASASEVPTVFENRDLALAHAVYLEAIREYLAHGSGSRGSALVLSGDGATSSGWVDEACRLEIAEPGGRGEHEILEVHLAAPHQVSCRWVSVRPVPDPETWFETVWRAYRNDEVIR